MRFMLIAKSKEPIAPPDQSLMVAVGQMTEEMAKSGILVGMGGFMPSATGAQARLTNGRITVEEGPFVDAKEVICGYAMVDVPSKTDAIELARRFLQVHVDALGAGFEMSSEIRQVFA